MSYKYNFIDFIDSPALKATLSEDMFTLGEQAALLSKSYRPVNEKIEALKYLRSICGDQMYCNRSDCKANDCLKKTIMLKDLIERTVFSWEEAINSLGTTGDVIYAAKLFEKGFEGSYFDSYRYFTDYERAYAYLKQEKQEYLDDKDLKDVVTYGRIERIPLNCGELPSCEWKSFHFDNELELYLILLPQKGDWDDILQRNLQDYYTYVPIPFKIGDQVVCDLGEAGVFQGEVFYDLDRRKDYRHVYCSQEDDSDSFVSICMYDKEQGTWYEADMMHILNLRYATEEECKSVPKYDGSTIF